MRGVWSKVATKPADGRSLAKTVLVMSTAMQSRHGQGVARANTMKIDMALSLEGMCKAMDGFVKVAEEMKSRMGDPTLDDGDGFVGEIWAEGDGDAEPFLAVMPWRLYAALRNGLSYDPGAIDPDHLGKQNELEDDQLAMLRAFMKLELEIGRAHV